MKLPYRILTVFGTRPEAIKMAPLINELRRHEGELAAVVCVTAQHRQMLDQVLSIYGIKPDYDLDIMREKQTLADITSRVLNGMYDLYENITPDMVLVHGDTTTTFAASLAAFYRHIPIGHVEAGLRTFDKYFPFPEEINRRLTGVLADIHFAPTQTAKKNLIKEGVAPDNIFVTGNTVIDALSNTVTDEYVFAEPRLREMDFARKRVIAVTAHRRENIGRPLKSICAALKDIAARYPDVEIVYPVHMNPAVRDTVFPILRGVGGVTLLDPLDIVEMHNLIARCYMVLTDSGGIQEEAPSLGKPVLVLRDVTERPEAVEAGAVRVVGTERRRVERAAAELLDDGEAYARMANPVNPYGDGSASRRIAQALLYRLGLAPPPKEFVPSGTRQGI